MDNYTRYSFFQLFTKSSDKRVGNFKIVVPIIQRDYAQGRTNEKANAVRKDFLTQLADYMTASTGSHDLDFVYGVSSPATDDSKKSEFIPLDGQQRLTTLFLLHYYFSVRTKGLALSDRFFKTLQKKSGKLSECLFTYRTRSSATDFCNALIREDNDFAQHFAKDEKGNRKTDKTLSDFICNTHWFYPDWLQDPTVKAILKMLDEIDDRFDNADHAAILGRLMSEDDPSVTFIFMNLDDYNLTDDLYIKMNSRGKALTLFENFKAKYEQYIGEQERGTIVREEDVSDTDNFAYVKKENCEVRKIDKSLFKFLLAIQGQNNKIIDSVKTNFAHKLDTAWASLFWEYSVDEIKEFEKAQNEKNENGAKPKTFEKRLSNTLDIKISKFIKMVLANQYAIDHSGGGVPIPEELTKNNELSFSELESIDALSPQGIVSISKMFDLYAGDGGKFKSILPQWVHERYYDEEVTFETLVNGKEFRFLPRLLMYAYSAFRLKFGGECLTEWMRFMYNMTSDDNTIQDITKNTYSRAVVSVNKLLSHLEKLSEPSIIQLLATENRPSKIEFFPEYQYREEILKSLLFKKDGINILNQAENQALDSSLDKTLSWESIILNLESHHYFTGQIGFILKMAGIDEYFSKNDNLDWGEGDDLKYKEAVVKYGRIASKIFEGGYSERKLAKNSLFERAMLSAHPDYYKWNLFNSVKKSYGSTNLLRDYSWKSNLRLTADNEKVYLMVKYLFDSLDEFNPVKSLYDIINNSKSLRPLWLNDIVRSDELMGLSKNGFFYKTQDGHRILIDRYNYSNTDHEVYSYVLYKEYLIKKWDSEIGWLEYKTANSGYDDIPHIRIHVAGLIVKVKSYVSSEDGELNSHYLWIDTSGAKWLEDYLTEHGFVKKSESDTMMRRVMNQWNKTKDINEYREKVSSGILDFIEGLSNVNKDLKDE